MPRNIRAPKSAGEVDRHHLHISLGWADDSTPEEAGGPGHGHATVQITDDRSRKTKGSDEHGNDRYRPLRAKLDANLLNMKLGDALDALCQMALDDDEQRAAELES